MEERAKMERIEDLERQRNEGLIRERVLSKKLIETTKEAAKYYTNWKKTEKMAQELEWKSREI